MTNRILHGRDEIWLDQERIINAAKSRLLGWPSFNIFAACRWIRKFWIFLETAEGPDYNVLCCSFSTAFFGRNFQISPRKTVSDAPHGQVKENRYYIFRIVSIRGCIHGNTIAGGQKHVGPYPTWILYSLATNICNSLTLSSISIFSFLLIFVSNVGVSFPW